MKIDPHFLKFTVARFAAAWRRVPFKLTCGIAAVILSAGSAVAQTTPGRSLPIRGGTEPFAITMAEDGNFYFTLSNSSKVGRLTPRGTINYSRTPSLSNPAFITPGQTATSGSVKARPARLPRSPRTASSRNISSPFSG
jgi:streptogramin lyase